MQLLERYLKSLSPLLPAELREDILRELSEDIQSEMDDKQSELGRPLTEDEQYEILKRRGNPLEVAAGYTSNRGTLAFGRQWIGPVLFPFYVRVLTFNLGLTFLIVGAVFAALSLSGQQVHFADIFSSVILQLFIQLSAVTLIFALVERHLSRHPHHWNPEKFKVELQVRIKKDIHQKIHKKIREVPRFESFSILVASTVALLWMQSLWSHPFLIFGPAASLIQLAPIWHRVYMPTVAVILAAMLRAAINLVRPDWIRFRDVAALVLDAASLAIIYALIFGCTWVVPATADSTVALHAAQAVNQWIPYGLWIAAVISLAQAIKNLLRLYYNLRWRDTAGA
ncbi:MAG TPA: hypothetical protein VNX66_14235 [Candidatus Sulfotelmatobacter sp.]|jgi:hypothetical protein|nr:hypothetical protein [Candidatus Sulfotelmatobacter sp.]